MRTLQAFVSFAALTFTLTLGVITSSWVAKTIPVGHAMRLQVRVEMFNAFNNVNYGQPNAIFGSATFGRISATSTTYSNMRQLQLGVKLIF